MPAGLARRGPRPAPAGSCTCRPDQKNPSASPCPPCWQLDPTEGSSEPRARRAPSPTRGSKTMTTPVTPTHRAGCDSGAVKLEAETGRLTVTPDGLGKSSEWPGRAGAGRQRSADGPRAGQRSGMSAACQLVRAPVGPKCRSGTFWGLGASQ